jgi:hypothetical protein
VQRCHDSALDGTGIDGRNGALDVAPVYIGNAACAGSLTSAQRTALQMIVHLGGGPPLQLAVDEPTQPFPVAGCV